ncbi:UTP18 isoform 5, partial [Pan troglodytes]
KIVRSFEVSPDGSFLLINGIAGYLHLLAMKTKELIGSMKINGRVAASTFSSDTKKVYASSGDGEVYVWDVNSRKCLNRFVDEGSLYGLSIATSRNGQYVACGCYFSDLQSYYRNLGNCFRKNERSSQIGSSSFLYSIFKLPSH